MKSLLGYSHKSWESDRMLFVVNDCPLSSRFKRHSVALQRKVEKSSTSCKFPVVQCEQQQGESKKVTTLSCVVWWLMATSEHNYSVAAEYVNYMFHETHTTAS